MGTSLAVNYACLYVGLIEVRQLLPVIKTIYCSANGLLMTELVSGSTPQVSSLNGLDFFDL
jgi:hypothetical protein